MSVVSSAQKYPIPIPFAPWPMCGMIVVVIVVVVVVVVEDYLPMDFTSL